MKAILRKSSGKNFSSAQLSDIESKPLNPGEIKVKMAASRVNPTDMLLMDKFPGLKYAKPQVAGIDGAGEVVETGTEVKDFSIGDKVFFFLPFDRMGSWTEVVNVEAGYAARIPKNLSMEEAGSIALPLVTAYEALGALRPESDKVILIHGAGGGVGYQAVQIAVALGMVVVATASFKDIDKIHQAGAKRVIDYNEEDFTELLRHHPPHYVLDVLGGEHLMKSIGLKPEKVVSIRYPDPKMKNCNGAPIAWGSRVSAGWKTSKYKNAAKKSVVELIFHCSEADGRILQQAAELIESLDYQVKPFETIGLENLVNGGLSERDLGKVIVFNP